MKGEILTGNELASGATIYLTASGEWVQDINRARVFAREEAALRDEWLARAKANHRILSLEIEAAERDGDKVIAELSFDHPIFDLAAINAQGRAAEISGRRSVHFCGAHLGYGFHEDGARSAVAVARALGVEA